MGFLRTRDALRNHSGLLYGARRYAALDDVRAGQLRRDWSDDRRCRQKHCGRYQRESLGWGENAVQPTVWHLEAGQYDESSGRRSLTRWFREEVVHTIHLMHAIDDVVKSMSTQPWGITEEQGRVLFEFILKEKPLSILELGCGVGTSACYMAAALDRNGGGRILSIDRNPELPEWVKSSFAKIDPSLQRMHDLIVTPRSYNDELMNLILRQSQGGKCEPCFDFCFIDGAHTWEVDSCAFFLAEKLLKPGGWMLFDDLTWTIGGSPEAIKNGVGQDMPPELLQTQQVMRVFELCVSQHPASILSRSPMTGVGPGRHLPKPVHRARRLPSLAFSAITGAPTTGSGPSAAGWRPADYRRLRLRSQNRAAPPPAAAIANVAGSGTPVACGDDS